MMRLRFTGIIVSIFLLVYSGCVSGRASRGLSPKTGTGDSSSSTGGVSPCIPGIFENFLISKTGFFEAQDCQKRCLTDKVIMLMSSSCEHCIETEPDFLAACEERGITPIILDMEKPEQVSTMESFGISICGTPTFILGCDYYLGAMDSEEDYLAIIDKYLSRQ